MNHQKSVPFRDLSRNMIATFTATIFLFLTILPYPCQAASEPLHEGEKPIALVNGTPILPSDMNCAAEAWRFTARHGTPPDHKGTLNQLIAIELLYQESLKHRFHGLVGDTEEVYMREIRQAGSEEKLQSTLQCNNISLQQFRQYIFRNLAINRLLDKEVYSRISVSEEEVREYYETNINNFKTPESVRLRQIFIKTPQTADRETLLDVERRAHDIFRKAANGSDFVMLARKYSDDPDGASLGGEMGVIYKGNIHNAFESLVFSRGEGSVTEPVKSFGGYHIFQIVSTQPSEPKPFDQVRSAIITNIRRAKARSMISQYVSSLREKADIHILIEKNED